MVKYLIYTDCHIGAGNYEWKGEFKYTDKTVFLNDNFEFKNIKKSYVETQIGKLIDHLHKSKEAGSINVASNHGVSIEKGIIGKYDHMVDGICFTHGHRVDYSEEKCDKWENRAPGIGRFALLAMRAKRHKFYESKWKVPSYELRKKLADYAKERLCRTIVVGHFHSKWDGMHDGVRIVMCGRGLTEVKI